MQAQVPADPYFGLWSRRPEDADRRKRQCEVFPRRRLPAGFRKIIEGKKRPTLVLEPFGRLIRTDKAALAVKGEALLRFATDAETHDVEFVHTD